MSCNIDYEFRRQFPDTVHALFMSSTEYAVTKHSDGHITNAYDGYWDELQPLGQASLVGPGTSEATDDPYPNWLRPVTDISAITNGSRVFLESIEFYLLDTTLTGGTGQEADVISEIYGSKSTDDAYQQSFYRNAIVPNFQPNFLRPSFLIDGKNVFAGLQSSNFGNHSNKGDLSIGLPFNKCYEFYKDFNKVGKIEAFASCAQIVDVSGTLYYQRYPVLCLATFWLGQSRGAI